MMTKPILLLILTSFLALPFAMFHGTDASAVECIPNGASPGGTLDITSPVSICSAVGNSGTININIPGAKDQYPYPELKIESLPCLAPCNANGKLDNKGTININEGVLKNESGDLFNRAGATVNINGKLNGNGSVNELQSGILNNRNNNFSNDGTIKINEAGTLNNSSQFSNKGTINMAQASVLSQSGTFSNLTAVTMGQGSTVNMDGGRLINDSGMLSKLATVTMGQGSAINMNGGTLVNNGRVDMAQGSAFTMNGGRLEGIGTISGTVFNYGGVVAPGGFNDVLHATIGKLNVGGYTQAANGALNFMIGQHQGIPLYTALNVTGPISILGGTISVSLNPGFVPKVGDKFDILTGQIQRISLTSPISLPPLPAGQFWGRANFGSFFELSVQQVQPPVVGSPEPGSFLLMGSGFAWLVGRQWRKHARSMQAARY